MSLNRRSSTARRCLPLAGEATALGGGTPTYLNKAQISRLMDLLRSHFHFSAEAEISIEVDPREIELDVLDHLRAEGFNRLSMGVQDFNKEVQRLVNREQDEAFI